MGFTKMSYINQRLIGGRSLLGKVKISTEAQGKSGSRGLGIPRKAQGQPPLPQERTEIGDQNLW